MYIYTFIYGFMIRCFVELFFSLITYSTNLHQQKHLPLFFYIFLFMLQLIPQSRYDIYVFSLDLNTMLSGFIMYSIHIWWLFNNHIHFPHFLKAALGCFVFFNSSGCENICVCCNIMYHIFWCYLCDGIKKRSKSMIIKKGSNVWWKC